MQPQRTDRVCSVDNREGRLIESRIVGLRTRDDAEAHSRAVGELVLRMSGRPRSVLFADHRPVKIYPPEVSERLEALFVKMNALSERVAILVARRNATLVLQPERLERLVRLVRHATHETRRVVFTPEEAKAHMAPALSAAQRRRARELLHERAHRS